MTRLSTLALAAALIVSGAAFAQQSGGTLVAAWNQEPVGFDPHIVSAVSSHQILTNVIDNLVTLDAEQNIVPELAESWEVSDDGLTLTFTLREGVRFSNGKDLELEIQARDAQGDVWLDKTYKESADTTAYAKDRPLDGRDPFQSIYNHIANDLLKQRDRHGIDRLIAA